MLRRKVVSTVTYLPFLTMEGNFDSFKIAKCLESISKLISIPRLNLKYMCLLPVAREPDVSGVVTLQDLNLEVP